MKKIFALILAVLMLAGVCTACQQGGTSSATPASSKDTTSQADSSAAPKAPVTIRYYYMNGVGEQQYTKQVAAKLNDMLSKTKGYEHITLELVPQSRDYQTNFTLDETSNKQIDLVATYGLDFTTACENGSFMDLSTLLTAHPDVTSEIPDWLVSMGKVNGKQYYVPSYGAATNGNFFIAPDEYLKDAKVTADDVRKVFQKGTLTDKLDFLETFCKDVRTSTGKNTKWITCPVYWQLYWVEYIDEDYGQLILRDGVDHPEYFTMTDDAKTMFSYAAKWYQAGLIHSDIATLKVADFFGANYLKDESYIYGMIQGTCSEEAAADSLTWQDTVPTTAVNLSDHWYIGSKWAAGGNAVHSTCKNPDEAMQIVELLMTKKGEEFYNTFAWGIENTHWKWVDQSKKRIETLEFASAQGGADTTYCTWKWNVGNTFNAWKNQPVADGDNDFVLNEVHNASTTSTSKMMGYTWDLSSVADQRTQCKTVTDEYYNNLRWGIYGANWEAKYNEYITKLKTAGIQDILDCVTKQYNDYQKSKK